MSAAEDRDALLRIPLTMTTEKTTTLAQDRADVQQAYADWREALRRRQVLGTMCHEYAGPTADAIAREAEARWRQLSDAYEARRRSEAP